MQVLVAKFNLINDCIGLKELHYLRVLQDSSNSTAPLAYFSLAHIRNSGGIATKS